MCLAPRGARPGLYGHPVLQGAFMCCCLGRALPHRKARLCPSTSPGLGGQGHSPGLGGQRHPV
eukprot:364051-Chlamydomonas_euryale.AAC.14